MGWRAPSEIQARGIAPAVPEERMGVVAYKGEERMGS